MEDLGTLIEQALAGNATAYGSLVRRYRPYAVGYARSLLHDAHWAEDAAQEAFLEAYACLPNIREPQAFPEWLKRIVFKHCDRLIRRRHIPTEPLESLAESTPGPTTDAATHELRETIKAAFDGLPESERTAASLFYLDGHSYQEISTFLKIPVSTVNNRLHASRKRLRSQLSEVAQLWGVRQTSRTKEKRLWLPENLLGRDMNMILEHEETCRNMLRGDAQVRIRAMRRDDIPALRWFDDELNAQLAAANAQIPPGGAESVPGGPWVRDDWLTLHFEKYAQRGNMTLLAEDTSGRIVGFADLWVAREPEPFGLSLNVECIDYFRAYYYQGLETVLLDEAESVARAAGLTALDIGSNTASGDYPSLRRFGLKVVYEYDMLGCRCSNAHRHSRLPHGQVTSANADLADLLKVSHWCPTDFTFREAMDGAWVDDMKGDPEQQLAFSAIHEIAWEENRALLELWWDDEESPAPSPWSPNNAELYVTPAVMKSVPQFSALLRECACLAAEVGAQEILLPCPSDLVPDSEYVTVENREFAFAWFRKDLSSRDEP